MITLNRKKVNYYPTMYVDGYSPTEIYISFIEHMRKLADEQREKMDFANIKIKS